MSLQGGVYFFNLEMPNFDMLSFENSIKKKLYRAGAGGQTSSEEVTFRLLPP